MSALPRPLKWPEQSIKPDSLPTVCLSLPLTEFLQKIMANPKHMRTMTATNRKPPHIVKSIFVWNAKIVKLRTTTWCQYKDKSMWRYEWHAYWSLGIRSAPDVDTTKPNAIFPCPSEPVSPPPGCNLRRKFPSQWERCWCCSDKPLHPAGILRKPSERKNNGEESYALREQEWGRPRCFAMLKRPSLRRQTGTETIGIPVTQGFIETTYR